MKFAALKRRLKTTEETERAIEKLKRISTVSLETAVNLEVDEYPFGRTSPLNTVQYFKNQRN